MIDAWRFGIQMKTRKVGVLCVLSPYQTCDSEEKKKKKETHLQFQLSNDRAADHDSSGSCEYDDG